MERLIKTNTKKLKYRYIILFLLVVLSFFLLLLRLF